jgi:hypothetical protein
LPLQPAYWSVVERVSPPTFPDFVRAWNARQGIQTPRHHVDIAEWLDARWRAGDARLLLLAFRSAGKSTLVGLFCAWLLADDPDRRILVLAADFALARKMVRNVKRIIERHPGTADLKPTRADQWAADQFTVNRPGEYRDPSMLARGITGNFTGSRADVVICDDVEVPRTSETAAKREDLRTRLREIDYVLVPGGTQIYIGTPHSCYSIYAREARPESGEAYPFLDGFVRYELPLLDAGGASAWPERFTPERIEEIRRQTGPNKFASQALLQPVDIRECRLDPTRMKRYEAALDYREANRIPSLRLGGKRLVSASCWWDPSYGSPRLGDASVIACVFTDEAGDRWLHDICYLTHDPNRVEEEDEASQLCRGVAAFVRRNHLPSVTVETNGIGRFLPGLLRQAFRREGLGCAVTERHTGRNKDERILDVFDQALAAGSLYAHQSVWQSPFIGEMRAWRPGLRCADDGLDAVSGCLWAEPVRFAAAPASAKIAWLGNWRGPALPVVANSNFDL